MSKQESNYKKNVLIRFKNYLVVTLGCLVLVAMIAPIVFWMKAKGEENLVLSKSKAVTLAVRNITLEYYATNQPFADQTAVFGITPEAASDIRELSGCEGNFYLLQWDNKNFAVKKSAYVENGYMVVYTLDDDSKQQWTLYRLDSKMAE